MLTKGRVDASHLDEARPRLVDTTRRGQVLDLTYWQAGKVDGVPRDFDHWTLSLTEQTKP